MRWRTNATDEVVASSSAVSSSTSTTFRSSRRSLNEQTEQDDSNGGKPKPSQNTQPENENGAAVTDSSSSAAASRGQKRSLEVEKKNSLGDPPETQNSSASCESPDKSDDEIEDDDEDDDGADHAEEYSPSTITWKPQSVQSTCEFTHTILDYAQKRESGCKKAEYSAITQDELGNRWRLIVYVNGNGRASNHHLSLFLQVADADDLPFGWKKAVSYVLTLEHPTNPELSYAKRNPDKTFKLCPKAIDWGWSQFITSDRIQQEGFVKLDTLTVRAQVTVKSSSVLIDEEDAELYLKCAVEEGDANSVKLCLDHGASVNCQFKDDLYTPLHTACSSGTSSGSLEVLNLLLSSGADCNACNKWKETPLLIAANNGHKAAVEALLEHGADPSLCSEAGWSALTFAAHKVVRLCCCVLCIQFTYRLSHSLFATLYRRVTMKLLTCCFKKEPL
jgi:Ankyrin repeats (many copies)/MATH domain